MSEPRALVEHFFRHEFGRLGAVLSRPFGVRRLALVEDVAGAALVQAREQVIRREPVQGRVGHVPVACRCTLTRGRV